MVAIVTVSMSMVALGELVVMIVGYIAIMILKINKRLFTIIRATQKRSLSSRSLYE